MDGPVTWILRTFVNEFLEDSSFYSDSIELGILSGKFLLEDINIKTSLFSDLNLPVTISNLSIGRLQLTLPWTDFFSGKLSLSIEDVAIFVKSNYDSPLAVDSKNKESEIHQLYQQLKKNTNNNNLTTNNSKSDSSNTTTNPIAYILNLIKSTLNNFIQSIEISIKNVHIRFDDYSTTHQGTSIGLMLSSLHITLTSMKQKSHSTIDNHNILSIHTEVNLQKLSIYMSPFQSFYDIPLPETKHIIQKWLLYNIKYPNNMILSHYIIKPMDVNVMITCSIEVETMNIQVNIDASIYDITTKITDSQLKDLITITTNMDHIQDASTLYSFRPKCKVQENPKLWWKYALQYVRKEVRGTLPTFTTQSLCSYHQYKLVYMFLYRRYLYQQKYNPTTNTTTTVSSSTSDAKSSHQNDVLPVINCEDNRYNKYIHSDIYRRQPFEQYILYHELLTYCLNRRKTSVITTHNHTNISEVFDSSHIYDDILLTEEMKLLLHTMEKELSVHVIVYYRLLCDKLFQEEIKYQTITAQQNNTNTATTTKENSSKVESMAVSKHESWWVTALNIFHSTNTTNHSDKDNHNGTNHTEGSTGDSSKKQKNDMTSMSPSSNSQNIPPKFSCDINFFIQQIVVECSTTTSMNTPFFIIDLSKLQLTTKLIPEQIDVSVSLQDLTVSTMVLFHPIEGVISVVDSRKETIISRKYYENPVDMSTPPSRVTSTSGIVGLTTPRKRTISTSSVNQSSSTSTMKYSNSTSYLSGYGTNKKSFLSLNMTISTQKKTTPIEIKLTIEPLQMNIKLYNQWIPRLGHFLETLNTMHTISYSLKTSRRMFPKAYSLTPRSPNILLHHLFKTHTTITMDIQISPLTISILHPDDDMILSEVIIEKVTVKTKETAADKCQLYINHVGSNKVLYTSGNTDTPLNHTIKQKIISMKMNDIAESDYYDIHQVSIQNIQMYMAEYNISTSINTSDVSIGASMSKKNRTHLKPLLSPMSLYLSAAVSSLGPQYSTLYPLAKVDLSVPSVQVLSTEQMCTHIIDIWSPILLRYMEPSIDTMITGTPYTASDKVDSEIHPLTERNIIQHSSTKQYTKAIIDSVDECDGNGGDDLGDDQFYDTYTADENHSVDKAGNNTTTTHSREEEDESYKGTNSHIFLRPLGKVSHKINDDNSLVDTASYYELPDLHDEDQVTSSTGRGEEDDNDDDDDDEMHTVHSYHTQDYNTAVAGGGLVDGSHSPNNSHMRVYRTILDIKNEIASWENKRKQLYADLLLLSKDPTYVSPTTTPTKTKNSMFNVSFVSPRQNTVAMKLTEDIEECNQEIFKLKDNMIEIQMSQWHDRQDVPMTTTTNSTARMSMISQLSENVEDQKPISRRRHVQDNKRTKSFVYLDDNYEEIWSKLFLQETAMIEETKQLLQPYYALKSCRIPQKYLSNDQLIQLVVSIKSIRCSYEYTVRSVVNNLVFEVSDLDVKFSQSACKMTLNMYLNSMTSYLQYISVSSSSTERPSSALSTSSTSNQNQAKVMTHLSGKSMTSVRDLFNNSPNNMNEEEDDMWIEQQFNSPLETCTSPQYVQSSIRGTPFEDITKEGVKYYIVQCLPSIASKLEHFIQVQFLYENKRGLSPYVNSDIHIGDIILTGSDIVMSSLLTHLTTMIQFSKLSIQHNLDWLQSKGIYSTSINKSHTTPSRMKQVISPSYDPMMTGDSGSENNVIQVKEISVMLPPINVDIFVNFRVAQVTLQIPSYLCNNDTNVAALDESDFNSKNAYFAFSLVDIHMGCNKRQESTVVSLNILDLSIYHIKSVTIPITITSNTNTNTHMTTTDGITKTDPTLLIPSSYESSESQFLLSRNRSVYDKAFLDMTLTTDISQQGRVSQPKLNIELSPIDMNIDILSYLSLVNIITTSNTYNEIQNLLTSAISPVIDIILSHDYVISTLSVASSAVKESTTKVRQSPTSQETAIDIYRLIYTLSRMKIDINIIVNEIGFHILPIHTPINRTVSDHALLALVIKSMKIQLVTGEYHDQSKEDIYFKIKLEDIEVMYGECIVVEAFNIYHSDTIILSENVSTNTHTANSISNNSTTIAGSYHANTSHLAIFKSCHSYTNISTIHLHFSEQLLGTIDTTMSNILQYIIPYSQYIGSQISPLMTTINQLSSLYERKMTSIHTQKSSSLSKTFNSISTTTSTTTASTNAAKKVSAPFSAKAHFKLLADIDNMIDAVIFYLQHTDIYCIFLIDNVIFDTNHSVLFGLTMSTSSSSSTTSTTSAALQDYVTFHMKHILLEWMTHHHSANKPLLTSSSNFITLMTMSIHHISLFHTTTTASSSSGVDTMDTNNVDMNNSVYVIEAPGHHLTTASSSSQDSPIPSNGDNLGDELHAVNILFGLTKVYAMSLSVALNSFHVTIQPVFIQYICSYIMNMSSMVDNQVTQYESFFNKYYANTDLSEVIEAFEDIDKNDPSIHPSYSSYMYPLSYPLLSLYSSLSTKIDSPVLESDDNVDTATVVILNETSFLLPKPLKSFSITIDMNDCQLFIYTADPSHKSSRNTTLSNSNNNNNNNSSSSSSSSSSSQSINTPREESIRVESGLRTVILWNSCSYCPNKQDLFSIKFISSAAVTHTKKYTLTRHLSQYPTHSEYTYISIPILSPLKMTLDYTCILTPIVLTTLMVSTPALSNMHMTHVIHGKIDGIYINIGTDYSPYISAVNILLDAATTRSMKITHVSMSNSTTESSYTPHTVVKNPRLSLNTDVNAISTLGRSQRIKDTSRMKASLVHASYVTLFPYALHFTDSVQVTFVVKDISIHLMQDHFLPNLKLLQIQVKDIQLNTSIAYHVPCIDYTSLSQHRIDLSVSNANTYNHGNTQHLIVAEVSISASLNCGITHYNQKSDTWSPLLDNTAICVEMSNNDLTTLLPQQLVLLTIQNRGQALYTETNTLVLYTVSSSIQKLLKHDRTTTTDSDSMCLMSSRTQSDQEVAPYKSITSLKTYNTQQYTNPWNIAVTVPDDVILQIDPQSIDIIANILGLVSADQVFLDQGYISNSLTIENTSGVTITYSFDYCGNNSSTYNPSLQQQDAVNETTRPSITLSTHTMSAISDISSSILARDLPHTVHFKIYENKSGINAGYDSSKSTDYLSFKLPLKPIKHYYIPLKNTTVLTQVNTSNVTHSSKVDDGGEVGIYVDITHYLGLWKIITYSALTIHNDIHKSIQIIGTTQEAIMSSMKAVSASTSTTTTTMKKNRLSTQLDGSTRGNTSQISQFTSYKSNMTITSQESPFIDSDDNFSYILPPSGTYRIPCTFTTVSDSQILLNILNTDGTVTTGYIPTPDSALYDQESRNNRYSNYNDDVWDPTQTDKSNTHQFHRQWNYDSNYNCQVLSYVHCVSMSHSKSREKSYVNAVVHLMKKSGHILQEIRVQDNLKIQNGLLSSVEYRIISSYHKPQEWTLFSGESNILSNIHPKNDFFISIRLKIPLCKYTNGDTSAETQYTSWSVPTRMPGCDTRHPKNYTKTCTVVYPNHAILSVQVNIQEVLCRREVTLYVPFWMTHTMPTTSTKKSSYSLQYQHDETSNPLSENKKYISELNGMDDLSADQYHRVSHTTSTLSSTSSADTEQQGFNKYNVFRWLVNFNSRRNDKTGETIPIKKALNFTSNNSTGIENQERYSIEDSSASMNIVQTSYTDVDLKECYIRMKFPLTSIWSPTINCHTLNKSMTIDCPLPLKKGIATSRESIEYVLTAQFMPKDTPFQFTKCIKITPKYTLVNTTSMTLEYKQYGSDSIHSVSRAAVKGESVPFIWTYGVTNKLVCIRLAGTKWSWSDTIDLNKTGTYHIYTIHEVTSTLCYFEVYVKVVGTCTTLEIHTPKKPYIPYRIENYTSHHLRLSPLSKGTCASYQYIPSMQYINYGSYLPSPRILHLDITMTSSSMASTSTSTSYESLIDINLNQYTLDQTIHLAYADIRIVCIQDGSTLVIQVMDTHDATVYHTIMSMKRQYIERLSSPICNIQFQLSQVYISILKKVDEPLLLLSINNLQYDGTISTIEQTHSIQLDTIQIDHPTVNDDCTYPCLLYAPQHITGTSSSSSSSKSVTTSPRGNMSPFLKVLVTLQMSSLSQSTNLSQRRFIYPVTLDSQVHIEPIQVSIDGDLLYDMIQYAILLDSKLSPALSTQCLSPSPILSHMNTTTPPSMTTITTMTTNYMSGYTYYQSLSKAYMKRLQQDTSVNLLYIRALKLSLIQVYFSLDPTILQSLQQLRTTTTATKTKTKTTNNISLNTTPISSPKQITDDLMVNTTVSDKFAPYIKLFSSVISRLTLIQDCVIQLQSFQLTSSLSTPMKKDSSHKSSTINTSGNTEKDGIIIGNITIASMMDQVVSHYIKQGSSQILQVLGSLNATEKPIALIQLFTQGIYDILTVMIHDTKNNQGNFYLSPSYMMKHIMTKIQSFIFKMISVSLLTSNLLIQPVLENIALLGNFNSMEIRNSNRRIQMNARKYRHAPMNENTTSLTSTTTIGKMYQLISSKDIYLTLFIFLHKYTLGLLLKPVFTFLQVTSTWSEQTALTLSPELKKCHPNQPPPITFPLKKE